MDKSTLSLFEDETYTLSATVSPSNATDKSVTWSSSNPSVATVSSSGVVTAVNAGTTTIKVKADDGSGVADSCSVTVKSREYVDLGLSVKWATCNVGASSPEEYGDYYAWGETETKSRYDESTYKWWRSNSSSFTKYCTDSSYGRVDYKKVLESSDDVAQVKWGGSWRMPTDEEMTELLENCTWTWTTQGGTNGCKVTSKKNGNSIFLPAAGYRNNSSLKYAGSYSDYWSSSLDWHEMGNDCAFGVGFNSSHGDRFISDRSYGYPVRPVCP